MAHLRSGVDAIVTGPETPLDSVPSTGPDHEPDERRTLLNIAYRLLGSLTEAEDAVQEAYARWYTLAPEQRRRIESPGAWMNTVVSRICLDVLRSARVRRERYVGEWLPEPVPDLADWPGVASTWAAADPAHQITLDESVGLAFLVILESMTPAERVVFVLHDVFRYSFPEVSRIVGRGPGACRQLAATARRRIGHVEPASPSPARRRLVRDLTRAWQTQDVATLIELLDPSVSATADGGGQVAASLHPVVGSHRVAAYLADIASRVDDLRLLERSVNGQPGIVAMGGQALLSVFALEISGDVVRRIWAIRNPDKLRPWSTGLA